MISLQGKVIVITGASSGIGAELARQCARRGAKLTLAARSEESLQTLQKEIESSGGEAVALRADVTDAKDIRRMMESALDRWTRIDILVNNAGFGLWGPFDKLSMEQIRQNFETNLFGAVACCQAALPHFRNQKSGMMVNVESVVALRAMPLSSCYSATKHALHAFSEAMRVEYGMEGIRVLSVCPGLISTPFHQHRVQVGPKMETGPKWLYLPVEQCASQIIRAMERERGQVVIARHAQFMALMQRLAPRLLDRILARNYRRAMRMAQSR